ncbi:Pimeloyl-ACP methyl ester carboxylesterase [Saccharopolyspora shandongensis]|uniref:Pimeloyl-ACP methyl ester carboxylesterase n=1 Tax=Saccharopolyspora shandongensis TaxID=418495 RepID=A0A1H3N970_9PSEU|nr:alpha/beta hydrolase [Saccharopolyspora shandongensis]SDY85210.1 Pimeloyl-ACP methyl ester carboxylesterase [Saccharopolyspora shandongensis]
MDVHHRTITVDGHAIFYREAGPSDAPALVLLHGFPSSSYMYRRLIPALADRYYVMAPDYLGFGESDAPSVEQFEYTFDSLAAIVDQLLDRLGVGSYAMYVQDYGAPIGWRLALAHPERITAIISQNGNAYEAGFVEGFWAPVWAYSTEPTPETETAVREALSMEAIRWQYLHGVADPSLVSPDTWTHDCALIQRPGNDQIQLRLFRDYATNRALYPRLQEYFRNSQVPLQAVWGANDGIFAPEGARAFANDLPNAEIHLLNAGHFALETQLDTITGYVHGFLGRVNSQSPASA